MTEIAIAAGQQPKPRVRPSGLRYKRRSRVPVSIDGVRQYTERKCLCCGKTFNSEGPFNRLCQPCKDEDSGSMG